MAESFLSTRARWFIAAGIFIVVLGLLFPVWTMEARSTISRPFSATLNAGRAFVLTPPARPTQDAEFKMPEYWTLDRLAMSSPRIDWTRTLVPVMAGLAILGLIAIIPKPNPEHPASSLCLQAGPHAEPNEINSSCNDNFLGTDGAITATSSIPERPDGAVRRALRFTFLSLSALLFAGNCLGLAGALVLPETRDTSWYSTGAGWRQLDQLAYAFGMNAWFLFAIGLASVPLAFTRDAGVRRRTKRWCVVIFVAWSVAFIVAFNMIE